MTRSSTKPDGKKSVSKFLEILFVSSFSTSFAKFSEFDAGNVILFPIKVFGRNIKETTLARYFIKLAPRPSFTRLRGGKTELI